MVRKVHRQRVKGIVNAGYVRHNDLNHIRAIIKAAERELVQ